MGRGLAGAVFGATRTTHDNVKKRLVTEPGIPIRRHWEASWKASYEASWKASWKAIWDP